MTPRLRITKRDLDAMEQIGKYGMLPAGRLEERFWGPERNSNGLSRLRRLAKEGLIRPLPEYIDSKLYYELTDKGRTLLRSVGYPPGTPLPRHGYASPRQHDLALIDIQELLEKSPFISTYSNEESLKRAYGHRANQPGAHKMPYKIPDGIAEFELEDGQRFNIAIELELTIKSRKIYEKIFKAYANATDFRTIIYIFKTESVLRSFKKILKTPGREDSYTRNFLRKHQLYFSLLGPMQEDPLNAPLSTLNGESMSVSMLLARGTKATGKPTTPQ